MSGLPKKPYEYGNEFHAIAALEQALVAVEKLFDAKIAAITDILAEVKRDVDAARAKLEAMETPTKKKAGKASADKAAKQEG